MNIVFNEAGFGMLIVRKAPDGSADALFSAADTEGLAGIAVKGWQKVEGSFELDPRFKDVGLPEGIFNSLKAKEAA